MENSSVLFKDPELDRLAASISARELLIQAGGSYSGYSRANLSYAIEQGTELLQAKGLLKHGEFETWCVTAPGRIHEISKATIVLYMKLVKNFDRIKDHCQKFNVALSELSICEARKIITDKPVKNEIKVHLKNGSYAWLHIKKSGCTLRIYESDQDWLLDKITEEEVI
jgi:hypothetical protein